MDPQGRKEVAHVLGELSDGGSTRVVLVLRGGEDLPDWITDVVEVREPLLSADSTSGPGLRFGRNGDEKGWWAEKLKIAEEEASRHESARVGSSSSASLKTVEGGGKELVRMEGVDVSYGEKQVSLSCFPFSRFKR